MADGKSTLREKTGVTQEDLDWWNEFWPTLEWTNARTWEDRAPHSYVTSINGKTPGLTKEDCIRAGKVIRTFGIPGKFFSKTGIYLYTPDGEWKFWTMDENVEDTDLINKAAADQVYGEQNAPDTSTNGRFTLYDEISADYDNLWQDEEDLEENAAVRKLLLDVFKGEAPRTLDIGCGTGLLLHTGVPSRYNYTGIDPSQGMLNELVRKWGTVEKLYAQPAGEVLPHLQPRSYDLVVALFAAASYLTREDLLRAVELSRDMTVFMTYEEGYLPDYYAEKGLPEPATNKEARETIHELGKRPNARMLKIGKFDVVVLHG